MADDIAATPASVNQRQCAPDLFCDTQVTDLSVSWDRCAHLHRLSPLNGKGPDVLSPAETRQSRAPLERIIVTAQEELDRLHAMVRPIGYATLLADPSGIIVERRCRHADAELFSQYGTRPGARWAEQAEGTNGIGTCIVEQRPLSVHRQQHYRQRYANLSCSGAPIFDADGRLKAVLNVASYATAVSDHSHALALAVAVDSARAIEERDFREGSRGLWTFALQAGDGGGPGMLLAVDAEHRIVMADRHARGAFTLNQADIGTGVHLRDVFERFPQIGRGGNAEDFAVALTQHGSGAQWRGLVTPPQTGAGAWRSDAQTTLHTRPRLALLCGMPPQAPKLAPRGGLSPRALCLVRQHIANNLERNIPVDQLAGMVGLSPTHFSRAFKNSVGVAPHHYLTQQRVDKAAQLLVETAQSLAQIAQAVGFSDQSHFTRCFTRLTGSTPSAYRHARR